MEWLTREYVDRHKRKRHATSTELRAQLEHYFRVLWSRGIRTTFASKADTLDRVMGHLFPPRSKSEPFGPDLHRIVQAVIEGARHTEYELRSVRKLMGALPGTKQKLLLTGILDLVIQQKHPLVYQRVFEWTSRPDLKGEPVDRPLTAKPGDVEIWDYKGTRSKTTLLEDYVRQLLTYAYLYRERTGELPARCVLYFVNEPDDNKKLLAIAVDDELIKLAVKWTHDQVVELQATLKVYQTDPTTVPGGERSLIKNPVGKRISTDLKAQCTACGERFDCEEYKKYLGRPDHADVSITDVTKN
jgi:hypothetical protein